MRRWLGQGSTAIVSKHPDATEAVQKPSTQTEFGMGLKHIEEI